MDFSADCWSGGQQKLPLSIIDLKIGQQDGSNHSSRKGDVSNKIMIQCNMCRVIAADR